MARHLFELYSLIAGDVVFLRHQPLKINASATLKFLDISQQSFGDKSTLYDPLKITATRPRFN